MEEKLDLTRKATLLVVDDTPANLALMSDLLKENYKVKVTTGGARALEIARSANPPDLILLDIMMPEMDGYTVCKELKRDPKTCGIPVIFLTAKSEPEDEEKGLAMGASDYITKPISPSVVMARIHTQLQLKSYSDHLENMVHERTLSLVRANTVLEKIVEAGIELGTERDPHNMLLRVLLAAQSVLQCQHGEFFLMRENNTLQLVANSRGNVSAGAEVPLHDPQTGLPCLRHALAYSALRSEVITVDNPAIDSRFDATTLPHGPMITIPLVLGGTRVLGVLRFFNAPDDQSTIEAERIRYVCALAPLLAIIASNFLLQQALS